jgi:putative CocE/NonD family hydrolase
MQIMKDIQVPTRDGTLLAADVFLPDDASPVPALVTLSPYQKDVPWYVPDGHTAQRHDYQCWETPDPLQWTAAGYAAVRVDARGSGRSGGVHGVLSREEARDYFDAIEWIAARDWCTGRIGATGVSYYAMTQWQVAALAPPSLKAMVPWSGSADIYREFVYRGGLLNYMFFDQWYSRLTVDHLHSGVRNRAAVYGSENALRQFALNELDSEFWEQRRPDPAKIAVPFISASSWSAWKGPGHIRGNLEMFKRASSESKRLRISHGNYFLEYYSDKIFDEQRRWFDYWLKGIGSPGDEAPVRLQVASVGGRPSKHWRHETAWPIPGTAVEELHLGRHEGAGLTLGAEPGRPGTAAYDAPGELSLDAEPILGAVDETAFGVSFDSATFNQEVDLVGEAALIVWASSSYNDLDLHVFLSVVDPDGSVHEISRGWLKASLRGLDAARSTPLRPYHAHDRLRPLIPGEPVRLDVEIWPIGIRLLPGQRLRLRLAGRGPGTLSGWHRRPRGRHTIHYGGTMPSRLMLPVVPPA